jgi:hypothetical protein
MKMNKRLKISRDSLVISIVDKFGKQKNVVYGNWNVVIRL